jgi:hypothetical protein
MAILLSVLGFLKRLFGVLWSFHPPGSMVLAVICFLAFLYEHYNVRSEEVIQFVPKIRIQEKKVPVYKVQIKEKAVIKERIVYKEVPVSQPVSRIEVKEERSEKILEVETLERDTATVHKIKVPERGAISALAKATETEKWAVRKPLFVFLNEFHWGVSILRREFGIHYSPLYINKVKLMFYATANFRIDPYELRGGAIGIKRRLFRTNIWYGLEFGTDRRLKKYYGASLSCELFRL